ncbi:hypothetical protein [Methylorubrum sp. SB2]|uniref:hypothetical protein n=1 Tax=Methylorubrum subtropicum TaxID=3138812 RepID=UPI00313DB92A
MRARRPFRPMLAVILQIVALLALSIAAPAHARAHGGAEHVHHAHVHHAHADPSGIDCAEAHGPVADASEPASDGHSGQCCGLHCPFHIPFVGVADVTVALRWNAEAAFRRPRDASFASVVSEALPEPPRSFA